MMDIKIESRRKSLPKLSQKNPDSLVLDLTSKAADQFVQFSPFYPHGDIPVPLSPGVTAQSVEGIWQGLKVFENHGIDAAKFAVSNMKGIKRTVRKYGRVLGHSAGVNSEKLLSYFEARCEIYLPAYAWVLQNKVNHLAAELHQLAQNQPLIFLDYETNPDIKNLQKPLSHAYLVKHYLEHGDFKALMNF